MRIYRNRQFEEIAQAVADADFDVNELSDVVLGTLEANEGIPENASLSCYCHFFHCANMKRVLEGLGVDNMPIQENDGNMPRLYDDFGSLGVWNRRNCMLADYHALVRAGNIVGALRITGQNKFPTRPISPAHVDRYLQFLDRWVCKIGGQLGYAVITPKGSKTSTSPVVPDFEKRGGVVAVMHSTALEYTDAVSEALDARGITYH